MLILHAVANYFSVSVNLLKDDVSLDIECILTTIVIVINSVCRLFGVFRHRAVFIDDRFTRRLAIYSKAFG